MLPVCRFGIRSVGGGGIQACFRTAARNTPGNSRKLHAPLGEVAAYAAFRPAKRRGVFLRVSIKRMVRPLLSPKEQPRKYRVATFPAGEVYSLRQSSKRVRLRIRLMKTTVAAVRPADDSRVRPRGNRFLLRPPARTRICLPR